MPSFKALNFMQILLALIFVAGVIGIGWYVVNNPEGAGNPNQPSLVPAVNSFAECEAAGYPLANTYPRKCLAPDGQEFVEEVSTPTTTSEVDYYNSSADMIVTDSPQAGDVVGKEFAVIGKARGTWFFEGSFPLEVRAPNGDLIGSAIATAEGDWMTTDWVNFKSEFFDLPSAYMGEATLILRKDNPSGMPEKDAYMSFPIVVEY